LPTPFLKSLDAPVNTFLIFSLFLSNTIILNVNALLKTDIKWKKIFNKEIGESQINCRGYSRKKIYGGDGMHFFSKTHYPYNF
jgi:hypothetical protein